MNFLGGGLYSLGGELNSLKKEVAFCGIFVLSYLRGGLAYFCTAFGDGVIEGRGSGSKFLLMERSLCNRAFKRNVT